MALARGPLRRLLRRRALRAWNSGQPLLILCYGNVNRSPYVERLAQRRPGASATSAGFFPAADRPAAERTVAYGAAHGVDLGAHRSRMVTNEQLRTAPAIFVFDAENVLMALTRAPSSIRRMHLVGALAARGPALIEDPHGRELAVLERTLSAITVAVDQAFVGGASFPPSSPSPRARTGCNGGCRPHQN